MSVAAGGDLEELGRDLGGDEGLVVDLAAFDERLVVLGVRDERRCGLGVDELC